MQFPTFFGISNLKSLIVKKYNQDLLDIRQWWNEHDSGARQWTTGNFLNSPTVPNGSKTTDAAAFGQIKYLQVVQATATTATTTTSSTFTAATNQSVAITPTSSSNRVKVTVSTYAEADAASTGIAITIKRGTTELSGVTNGFAFVATNVAGLSSDTGCVSFSYIDSPATTSATTYQVFFRSTDNSSTVQCGSTTLRSVIIAEEIV